MLRKHLTSELYVYMNDHHVGYLRRLASGLLSYEYVTEWLNNDNRRPISFSLPLREQPYNGDVVYNYFDNLLPDNESLRTRIQHRLGADSNSAYDLLAKIGADCVGALQILSEPLKVKKKNKIAARKVTNKEVATIIKNYKNAPLGMSPDDDFRISIAGAQEKTAFLWYEKSWHVPEHTTPTTHIFKLPIGRIGHSGIDLSESVENEWLCLQILKQFNLPVNNAVIFEQDDAKALVCERFDREWDQKTSQFIRLLQEDMCQVNGLSSAFKYEAHGGPGIENIMMFLNASLDSQQDRNQFFKTCFLFWVLGAIDGHAKNFSIFIKPEGRYNLTPIYDVISAYPLSDKHQIEYKELKMAMSVRGKNKHYHLHEIRKRHWLEMGNVCKFSAKEISEIISYVFDNMDHVIDSVSALLPKSFPTQMAESIFTNMKNIKKIN